MADSTDILALERRIEQLERSAQRSRWGAIAATAALLAVSAVGASQQPATSGPIAIRDTNGHVRVRIDDTGLLLTDANGTKRLRLGYNTHDQPALNLYDASGTLRLESYLAPKQTAQLVFHDKDANPRQWLGLGDDGTPFVEEMNADGKDLVYLAGTAKPRLRFYDGVNERAVIGMSSDGDGLLRMFDAAGKESVSLEGQTKPFLRLSEREIERIYFGLSSEDSPLVFLNGATGKAIVDIEAQADPYIRLRDGNNAERGYFGVFDNHASGLAIYDATGTQQWSTP